MRYTLKFGITLMIVSALSAVSLAVVYNATEGKRIQAAEEEKQEALAEVLPEAKVFELVEKAGISYYIGYKSPDKQQAAGYASVAEGKGYSSVIKTMVGITSEGKITGLKILSQQETPGLGARVEEIRSGKTIKDVFQKDSEEAKGEQKPWFQKQFVGKRLNDLRIEKIEAITGATITSKAIVDSVRKQIKRVLEEQKQGIQ